MRKLLLYSICCCLTVISWAQTPGNNPSFSNLRKKSISTLKDSIRIDTVSIIPKTFFIAGIADTTYEIDHVNAILRWKHRPAMDSVQVTYRSFGYKLNTVTQRMKFDSIQNNFLAPVNLSTIYQQQRDDRFFNFGNINYNGSFGRGISFGNSQDAVLTSTLNLQLSGYLADSIEIAAAITDNNIPIQPDGTTQQLNEFDRIFLQFRKKGWALSLGDIDIRQQQSKNYFLSFYKRLQGASFETTNKIGKRSTNTAMLSGSIAKGKFTRNIFQGQEGNQGPYRLVGANNELFFVVQANTERVFIDGEQLQRGEDQDYVINYNTAEITFTPRRMITKDKRIQVEFEYADRNYLNVNLFASNETNINNKVKLRFGVFNNNDAKNSPINQTLDPAQKRFLDNIGDSINRAFYPVATLDTFGAGKILYRKIDSIYNGGASRDSVYVYDSIGLGPNYSLTFIDIGQGNGDYIPDLNGANGKVYKWIEPIGGFKQGRFAPVTYLVTPKKQQVVAMGIDYVLNKHTTIITDFGYSNYDINIFSSKDKRNDKGYASRIQLKNVHSLGGKNKIQLLTEGSYENVDKKFRPLERLRNVEFTRDWGLPLVVEAANERIYMGSGQLLDAKQNSLKYQFTQYNRGTYFTGYRNSLSHQHEIKGWRLNNIFSLTNTFSTTEKGYFLRPTVDISKQFAKLRNYVIGATYSVEHNQIKNKFTDSVTLTSFAFQTTQLYLKSDPAKLNRWGVTYFTREDKYPYGKELVKGDRSQNVNFFMELTKSQKHQFRLNTTFRNLEVLQPAVTTQKADQSLLGRAEYLVNEWKGLVTGNVLYEVGAGQEQKRDFAFLEVPAGQGEYTWNDYNGDGVQQLNEFEIALFQDQAKYIRIFTPSNEFVKANYNTFNYSVSLNPRAVMDIYHTKGFRKIIANMNFQSSLQRAKKEVASGITQFNPFSKALNDTSLISLTSIFVNTFSYNRFSSKWGTDVSNTRNSSKALLTYGYESRRFDEWSFKIRWNLSKLISTDVAYRTGSNKLATSNVKFDNRNYDVEQYSVEPRLSITRGASFRAITGYRYSNKQNRVNDQEKYTSHSLNEDIKYNILQSTSIQGKFTYTNITFISKINPTVNTNTTVAYNMLDGLLPGKNFLWTLDLTKRLSNNLELNIQYEGRKPGAARTVHIGRASIRALL